MNSLPTSLRIFLSHILFLLGFFLFASPGTSATQQENPGVIWSGQGETIFSVQRIVRNKNSLQVTGSFQKFSSEKNYFSRRWSRDNLTSNCPAFKVIDPLTQKFGGPARLPDGNCAVSELPFMLKAGQQFSFTVEMVDPGGSRLDVVSSLAGVAYGVPVTGAESPSSQPAPSIDYGTYSLRWVDPAPRIRDEGARVTRREKVTIDLDNDVLFATESAALSSKAKATLAVAVKELQGQPGRKVAVSGHTDSRGSASFGQDLSERRAEAVRAYLSAQLGSGWQFEARGFGEDKPLVPEYDKNGKANPEAMALNRRVELAVQ
ncbi:MAG: OmpA family protein [Actinomycetota bacterium]